MRIIEFLLAKIKLSIIGKYKFQYKLLTFMS